MYAARSINNVFTCSMRNMVRLPSRMGYRVTVSYVGSGGAAKHKPVSSPSRASFASEPPDHKHSPVTGRRPPPPPSVILSARIKNYKIPDPESQNGVDLTLSSHASELPGTDSQSLSWNLQEVSLSFQLFVLTLPINTLAVATRTLRPQILTSVPDNNSDSTPWLCYELPSLRPLPQQRLLLPAHMELT